MVKSMTGFARSDGSHGAVGWHWEARTVNSRGLDVRVRLPAGYEVMEQRVRDLCKTAFARGNCSLALNVSRDPSAGQFRLNEAALAQIAALMARAREIVDASPPSLDGILALKGVLETGEGAADQAAPAQVMEAMLGDLGQVLAQVVQVREAEGARLKVAIALLLDEIERLVGVVETAPGRKPDVINERIREQIQRLVGDAPRLDEQRLYQEAMLLAAKADIHEEIDRLRAHIAATRDILESGEPAGRQLEFLAQEFNRESNTICAKANDREISQTGLAMKAAVDRLREQVQNIE